MKPLRKIQDVKSGSIRIDLPAGFHAKRVEITIQPIDNWEKRQLLDLLLEAPTLTDEELQGYNNVRNWMNKWGS